MPMPTLPHELECCSTPSLSPSYQVLENALQSVVLAAWYSALKRWHSSSSSGRQQGGWRLVRAVHALDVGLNVHVIWLAVFVRPSPPS